MTTSSNRQSQLWVVFYLLAITSTSLVHSFHSAALFVPCRTTRRNQPRPLQSSSSDDDSFMKSLQNRIAKVADKETKLPIVVVDTMLPRQSIKIEVEQTDIIFHRLIKTLVEDERPFFGMVGMARLNTGQTLPLQNGVKVQIVGNPQVVSESGALRVQLKAQERFRITGELDTQEEESKGWTEARVRFLDSAEEQEAEETGPNPLSLAKAMNRARELTSPNGNMPNGMSLKDRWIELAKENERAPNQINELLDEIGQVPPATEPSEVAFWIGALINPLPGMGVAMEIRPQLLMAATAEERIEVALQGILASIRHMDGTKPLF